MQLLHQALLDNYIAMPGPTPLAHNQGQRVHTLELGINEGIIWPTEIFISSADSQGKKT